MRYASACSGIEAATVAWHPLGWVPVWFSQYDPEHNYEKNGPDFASAVLQHHYPGVPNLGDMLKLRQNKIYNEQSIDLFVAGTPCQSFSIAGLRKGLGDERGNLALEFVRILIEKRPGWFVWENVPGVLTSGKEGATEGEGEESEEFDGDPRDFACLLSAWTGRDIAPQEFEKGGAIEAETEQDYSVAWRIFDSQYFGVPQRRRRIFVVGYLGKDWRPPVAVLFEQDSLRRDFTPGGKKRKGSSGNTKAGAGGSSEIGYRQRGFGDYTADDTADDTASALKKRDYKDATDLVCFGADLSGRDAGESMKEELAPTLTSGTHVGHGAHVITASIDCRNDVVNDEISGTLQAKSNGGQSLNFINPVFIVERNTAYGIQSVAINRKPENGGNGLGFKEEQAPTLTKMDRHGVMHTVFDTTQVTSPENGSNPQPGDPCHPLVKNGHAPLVEQTFSDNSNRGFRVHDGVTPPLLRNMGTGGGNVPFIAQDNPIAFKERAGKPGGGKGYLGSEELAFTLSRGHDQNIIYKTLIRRLTPLECCRLQGFPDDYLCNVPGATDSKMYSVLGNSMTTWVMQFIGKRIDLVDKVLRELREPDVQGSVATKFNH